MPKFIVSYSLPYEHYCEIGIVAEDDEAAKEKAAELFDSGEFWEDTEEYPLLEDIYSEVDDGAVLEFEVQKTLPDDQAWPAQSYAVRQYKEDKAAVAFLRMVAKLNYEGEQLEDGSEFIMETDYAVLKLNRLIVKAREILGLDKE